MSADAATLAVYASRAQDYADLNADSQAGGSLDRFVGALPPGARVLDLGCGPGADAVAMREAGLAVDAMDASGEMVRLARRLHGLNVRCAGFETLDDVAAYDAVWASFSLLHAPKSDMPDLLMRIRRALRPSGLFGLGLKTGIGESRDSLGRFYAFYAINELEQLLAAADFTVQDMRTGASSGLDGTVAPWVRITARA